MNRYDLVCAVIAVIGVLTEFLLKGTSAAIGFSIGIAATTFNLVALGMAIRAFGQMMASRSSPFWPTAGILAAVAAKLPILIAAGWYVQRLSDVAFDAFLLGLLLVYCATVGRAQFIGLKA
jgi:hypothetical protein